MPSKYTLACKNESVKYPSPRMFYKQLYPLLYLQFLLCAIIPLYSKSKNTCAEASNYLPNNDTLKIRWHSWQKAYSWATNEKKIIVVYVHTNWCLWCKKLEKDVFENPTVVTYLDSFFVATQLNPEITDSLYFYRGKKYKGKELISKLADDEAGIYPNLIVIIPIPNADSDKIYTLPGYFRPKELLSLLRDIKSRNP